MVPMDQPSKPICAVLLLEPVAKSSRSSKTLPSLGSKSRLPLASIACRSRGMMTPATEEVAGAGADQDAALLLLAVSRLPLAAAPLTVTPLSTCVFRLGTSVVLAIGNGAVPVARLLVTCPVKSPVPKPCAAAPRLQVPLPEHWMVVPVSTKFPP